jgi:hypothetical protein
MSDQPLYDGLNAAPSAPTTDRPEPNTIDIFNEEARAWRDRANELTDYTLKYLVNRTDIYG